MVPPRKRIPYPRPASGFTLVELLVVFALLALLVGLVPIAFGKLQESVQYRDTVRAALSDMRTARFLAQSRGTEVRFVVNLQQRSFGIEGQPPHLVMPPLELRTTATWDVGNGSLGLLWRLVDAQDRVAIGQGNVVGQDIGASKGFGTLAINGAMRNLRA